MLFESMVDIIGRQTKVDEDDYPHKKQSNFTLNVCCKATQQHMDYVFV